MGKIRIDLDGSFTENKAYYVVADEGFTVDANTGEPSPAITDTNAVTFTALPGYTDIETVPADDAVSADDFQFDVISKSKRIDITFEQDVFVGTGDIRLYNSSDAVIQTFDVTTDVYFRYSPPDAPNTTGKKVTIFANYITNWLDDTSPSYIQIDDGAFLDANCMTNRAIDTRTSSDVTVDFNFQTLPTRQSVSESYIDIQYCEGGLVKGSGNVYLYDSTDTLIETIDVDTSGSIVTITNDDDLTNNGLRIVPKYELQEETDYYVTSDRGVIGDTHGFSYGPIVKNDTGVETTFYKPYVLGDFIIQFNRDVRRGEGKVYLKKQSDDSTVKWWDIQWDDEWIGTNDLTADDLITLTDNRAFFKAEVAQGIGYYILIDDGAFVDLDQIPFTGYSLASDWDFVIYDGPAVQSASYASGGDVTLAFNEDINHEVTGNLYLHLDIDDSLVNTVSTSGATILNEDLTFASGIFGLGGDDYYVLTDKEIVANDYNFQHRAETDKTIATFTSTTSILALTPNDDSSDVTDLATTGFSIQFDRNITAGAGNITLKKTSDDSTVETFDSNDFNIVDDTVTCIVTVELEDLTGYYVTVDNNAINSTGGYFDGITDKTYFNFTINGLNIASSTPSDNETGVDYFATTGITIVFDDDITVNTGNIYLKKTSNDSIIETFDVTTDITTPTSSSINFIVTQTLLGTTDYYITIDAGTFTDTNNNDYNGLTDKTVLNFETSGMDISTSSPLDNETGVDYFATTGIDITFDTGFTINTGNIYLKDSSDDSTIETFDVTTDITKVDETISFTSTVNLEPLTGCYITIDSGAFTDDNSIVYGGISDKTKLNFTIDVEPAISSSNPPDDGDMGSKQVSVTFDVNMKVGTGNITMKKTSDDSTIETFDVTTDVNITNNVVSFTVTAELDPYTGYYFLIDDGALISTENIIYNGISSKTGWNATSTYDINTVTRILEFTTTDTLGSCNCGVTVLDVVADSSNNRYVTGYIEHPTDGRSFVAKLDRDGVVQWSRDLENQLGVYPKMVSIDIDSSGNVYVAGRDASESQAIMGKYNNSGTIQWQKEFVDTNHFYSITDIKVLSDDTFIVLGATSTSDSVGIAKYNGSASLQWMKEIALTSLSYDTDPQYNNLYIDSSDNIYFGIRESANGDTHFVKMLSTGVIDWQKSFDFSSGTSYYRGCVVDSSNNVYVGVHPNKIIKFNSAGVFQSKHNVSSAGQITSMYIDDDDSIYIGFSGGYVGKLNSSLVGQWGNQIRVGQPGILTTSEYITRTYVDNFNLIMAGWASEISPDPNEKYGQIYEFKPSGGGLGTYDYISYELGTTPEVTTDTEITVNTSSLSTSSATHAHSASSFNDATGTVIVVDLK